jgi:hypothetical protein
VLEKEAVLEGAGLEGAEAGEGGGEEEEEEGAVLEGEDAEEEALLLLFLMLLLLICRTAVSQCPGLAIPPEHRTSCAAASHCRRT